MAERLPPSLDSSAEGARASDPLGPIWALGRRQARFGAVMGFLVALLLHGAAAGQAATTLYDIGGYAARVSDYVKNSLRLEIEIDTSEPPPPPEPPAPEPPPPEPEPQQAPTPPPEQQPTEEPPPPPAPAEAGQVLTAEPDPDAPVDLTGDTIVTGTGEFRGGITSSTGTSKTAVRDVRAQPGGVVGGTGTAPAPPRPVRDLSRPAAPIGTSWSDCGFPEEADLDGVDYGVVKLVVAVGADGRAKSVTVLSDPGSGFGSLARRCALRRSFQPALDAAGQPITSSTPPFTVRFTR
jgi:protein TonB